MPHSGPGVNRAVPNTILWGSESIYYTGRRMHSISCVTWRKSAWHWRNMARPNERGSYVSPDEDGQDARDWMYVANTCFCVAHTAANEGGSKRVRPSVRSVLVLDKEKDKCVWDQARSGRQMLRWRLTCMLCKKIRVPIWKTKCPPNQRISRYLSGCNNEEQCTVYAHQRSLLKISMQHQI